MVDYDFWQEWKQKNEIEKKAIILLERVRNFIIKSIPKEALVAIYVKGSFARREMREGSDIDIVPIVTENKYEKAIFNVNSLNIYPCVVVPLSLWELKTNKFFTKSKFSHELRAKPDRFLNKLNEYKLIYGKPLNLKNYSIRNNIEVLRDEINIIKNGYIPLYEKGKIGFSPLLKEVFWLVELEQIIKGKEVIHSFKGIKQSVKDRNHIIHDAFLFRDQHIKDKIEENAFILKLKKYLNDLKKLF